MVDSDAETARKIEARKLLRQIQTLRGCDGIIALEFSHTDDAPNKVMTYSKVGEVPFLNEVILALATLVATQAFEAGKKEGTDLTKYNMDAPPGQSG